MQFQLPQFIETEDKIVGPFSIKQFAYLCAVGGFVALLYFILTPVVWLVIAIPLVAAAFAFAFIRINGQSLSRIALSAFKFYWNPQTYVWHAEHPQIQKPEASTAQRDGFSLEHVVQGMALKRTWQNVQTGTPSSPAEAAKRTFAQMRERYEVFEKRTGERTAARRVDYR